MDMRFDGQFFELVLGPGDAVGPFVVRTNKPGHTYEIKIDLENMPRDTHFEAHCKLSPETIKRLSAQAKWWKSVAAKEAKQKASSEDEQGD